MVHPRVHHVPWLKSADLDNARTKSREQKKKIISSYMYVNRLSKFFEEGRITRPIWNFTMS